MVLDTINGIRGMFKIFGVRNTLWYSVEGSLDRRVREHFRKKTDKYLIDLLSVHTAELGVYSAINFFLNSPSSKDTYLLTNEELAFFSQYFREDNEKTTKKSLEELYLQLKSAMPKVMLLTKFLLCRRISKKLLELIEENSKNQEMALQWLWLLEGHLRKLCEENKVDFYEPLVNNLSCKRKVINELKFISKRLTAFANSNKFEPELKARVITIMNVIGINSSAYFLRLLVKAKTEDEIKAAAYAFFSREKNKPLSVKKSSKVVSFILDKCYKANHSPHPAIINFVDNLIENHTEHYQSISLKFVFPLKKYVYYLKRQVLTGDILPSDSIPHIRKIFDTQTALKLLTSVVENSVDVEKQRAAFNELISIQAEKAVAKWPLSIKLEKRDISICLLKRFDLYTPYKKSINKAIAMALNNSTLRSSSLIRYFAVCPSYSVPYLNAKISAFSNEFKVLDRRYKKQETEIKKNFRKLMSKNLEVEEKRAIVASMAEKKYCGSEWKKSRDLLENFKWLKNNLLSMK